MAQIVFEKSNINVKETVKEVDEIWAGSDEIMLLTEKVQISSWKGGLENNHYEDYPIYVNKRNVLLFR